MKSHTKTALAFIVALTVMAAATSIARGESPKGDTGPGHNKQGDLRRRLPIIPIPPGDIRNPFYWAWVADQIGTHRRFGDNVPVPGGGAEDGDLPPG